MYTQCPHCLTIFNIQRKQLKTARGEVRCAHCHNVFNASKYKLKKLPKENEDGPYTTSEEELEPLPDILRDDAAPPSTGISLASLLAWGLLSFLFALLLIGQLLWFHYPDRIVHHPQLRPLLLQACDVFNCTLPVSASANPFHMQTHAAYAPAEYENVIQFDAEFINQTEIAQPYPTLQLTFENANEHPIAQRQFTPAEYRLGKTHNRRERIPPGVTVSLRLQIVDVGSMLEGGEIMEGYRFEFL